MSDDRRASVGIRPALSDSLRHPRRCGDLTVGGQAPAPKAASFLQGLKPVERVRLLRGGYKPPPPKEKAQASPGLKPKIMGNAVARRLERRRSPD
jgi:hypothetical protein